MSISAAGYVALDQSNQAEKKAVAAQKGVDETAPVVNQTAKAAQKNDFTLDQIIRVLKRKNLLKHGAQGVQGTSGATGAIGPRGHSGPSGPAGSKGATGPAGPDGKDGQNGASLTLSDLTAYCETHGCRGREGEPGPQGEEGPVGPAGPAGPQGESGPAGPQGEPGPAGPPAAPAPCDPALGYVCQ